ncbi:cytochrome c3 family protein [Desulfurobacterium atlanticum]|nr:cytochrome c3 family protein [Desulfurobacterium atlanticum]
MKVKMFNLLVLITFLIFLPRVNAANIGMYLKSAHGNATYGVNRNSMSGYSIGNCDHCHEMHASQNGVEPTPQNGSPSPFALFAPNFNTAKTTNPYTLSDNYCFYCHSTTTDGSVQVGGIDNHNFSYTFGGYTSSSVTGIYQMFNQASYHNLYDLHQFALGNAGSTTLPFSTFYKQQSNPCDTCHNPHIVRANKRNVSDPTYTPLSKPSDHNNLWGDDANETLAALTNAYQPPYYYGSTTTFEPDGAADTPSNQAAKMPDYITYCTDCHNTVNKIYSTTLGRELYEIDWFSDDGDKHGFRVADSDVGVGDTNTASLKRPYNGSPIANANGAGFVVSCMDCHEAHGSKHAYLIREEVNGKVMESIVNDYNLSELCRKCHMDDEAAYGRASGRNKWRYVHHRAPDAPYHGGGCGPCHGRFGGTGPDSCIKCHFHGGTDKVLGTMATKRRTF